MPHILSTTKFYVTSTTNSYSARQDLLINEFSSKSDERTPPKSPIEVPVGVVLVLARGNSDPARRDLIGNEFSSKCDPYKVIIRTS